MLSLRFDFTLDNPGHLSCRSEFYYRVFENEETPMKTRWRQFLCLTFLFPGVYFYLSEHTLGGGQRVGPLVKIENYFDYRFEHYRLYLVVTTHHTHVYIRFVCLFRHDWVPFPPIYAFWITMMSLYIKQEFTVVDFLSDKSLWSECQNYPNPDRSVTETHPELTEKTIEFTTFK